MTLQGTPSARYPHSGIRLSLVWFIAGLLVGCNPKYASKHREYADPDDELYGAIEMESSHSDLRKGLKHGSRV